MSMANARGMVDLAAGKCRGGLGTVQIQAQPQNQKYLFNKFVFQATPDVLKTPFLR
jgi:hypothetical protein